MRRQTELEVGQTHGDDRGSHQASPTLTPPCLPYPLGWVEPRWEQFAALLPERPDSHPLGCHRPRIADRIVFDKLIQVLIFGCAYERIADHTCSERTLRRGRDEWIAAGIDQHLGRIARQAYDRMIGLNLEDLAIDGCITKAPCGGEATGRSPVDRGKQGRKRSVASDGGGIPLGCVVAAANTHDSPLLAPTLESLAEVGPLPTRPTIHLDRGYDSDKTRTALAERGLIGRIAAKGKPAPVQTGTGGRWSACTPGPTPSASCDGVPSGANGWSSSGSPLPTRSSSCVD